MSLKRKAPEPQAPTPAASEHIYTSSPINDRSSTFIGRYSPTASVKALQSSPDFKDASHRMAAWRKPSTQRAILTASQPQRKIYDVGHDDDGEKYGGKRLEKLLEELDVEGALVVARWYGGVMLGPVRFTHIEDCAKEAILRSHEAEANEQTEKRQRLQNDEDATRKAKLETVLVQRDNSITVLRGLLVEKSDNSITVLRGLLAEKSASSGATTDSQPPTPAKSMDYQKLPLPALLKLEKARDKTISWLLEQISKVEADAATTKVSLKDGGNGENNSTLPKGPDEDNRAKEIPHQSSHNSTPPESLNENDGSAELPHQSSDTTDPEARREAVTSRQERTDPF